MMVRPPLIFIAGPYSGEERWEVEENIAQAERCGLRVAKLGGMPVIPHANTASPDFEKVQPYEFWIAGTMALMRASDAVLMLPGWEDSKGAWGEHKAAQFYGMRVFYHHDLGALGALEAWVRGWK